MVKKFTLTIMLLCTFCTSFATNYLTFTTEADSSSFGIHNEWGNNPDVQYSLDGGKTWTKLTNDTLIDLPNKKKALLRGHNPQGISRGDSSFTRFVMTGRIAASGSVMSLIDGKGESLVIPGEKCFRNLFDECRSLTQAPQLPATTLAKGCYMGMFAGCASLTQAPQLPAMTLDTSCYSFMFGGCTSLTQAPELPATKLALDCYGAMFLGCTSLKRVPKLPATELAEGCYQIMFRECTSLRQAPALPATTLTTYCYSSMFEGCTSLTQAPELPATTSEMGCYATMFKGCSNLAEINVGLIAWDSGTFFWLIDVAPKGKFICPKELPKEFGKSRIPEGWTIINN